MTLSYLLTTVLTALSAYAKSEDNPCEDCTDCKGRVGFSPTVVKRTCAQCVRRELAIKVQERNLVALHIFQKKSEWSKHIFMNVYEHSMKPLKEDGSGPDVEWKDIDFDDDCEFTRTFLLGFVSGNWDAILLQKPKLEGYPFRIEEVNISTYLDCGKDSTKSANISAVRAHLESGIRAAIVDQDTEKRVRLQAVLNLTQGNFGFGAEIGFRAQILKEEVVPGGNPYFDIWYSKWFCCQTESDVRLDFLEGWCDLHRLRAEPGSAYATTTMDYLPLWYGADYQECKNLVDIGVPRLVRESGHIYLSGFEAWTASGWSKTFIGRIKQVGLLATTDFLMLSAKIQGALLAHFKKLEDIPASVLKKVQGLPDDDALAFIFKKKKVECSVDSSIDKIWKTGRSPNVPITKEVIREAVEEVLAKQGKKKSGKAGFEASMYFDPTAAPDSLSGWSAPKKKAGGKKSAKAGKSTPKSGAPKAVAWGGKPVPGLGQKKPSSPLPREEWNGPRPPWAQQKGPHVNGPKQPRKGGVNGWTEKPAKGQQSWSEVVQRPRHPKKSDERILAAFQKGTLAECESEVRRVLPGKGKLDLSRAAGFWNNGRPNPHGKSKAEVSQLIYLN